jgi:hypothetical protein
MTGNDRVLMKLMGMNEEIKPAKSAAFYIWV